MPAFGLNDDLIKPFGLSDADVGQSSVTQPVVAGGVKQVANVAQSNTRKIYTAGGVTDAPIEETNQTRASETGVDVNTGADVGTRVGLGFSPEGPQQLQYLAARLQQAYKMPVQVRIGPQSKEPEFFSPTTQKWTSAKGSGLVPGALSAAASVAGTVAGTALGAPGGPVGAGAGAIAGAGAGGAAGAGINLGIGKAIGAVDENYPIGSDIGGEALKGAGIEAGSLGVLGAAKYARYWFKGARAFGAKEAAELGAAAAKADKVVQEIKDKSGVDFNPTVGQRTSSTMRSTELGQKALGMDAALRRDPTTGDKMRALSSSNEDALTGYFDASTTPLQQQSADGAVQLSQQDATKQVASGLTSGYDSLMATTRDLVSKLPDTLPAAETGGILRAALVKADRAFKSEVENPAWAKYRDGTGYNPKTYTSDIHVPWNDDVRNLMESWDARSRQAVMKLIQNDNSGLKLLFKKEADTPASMILDANGMPAKVAVKGGDVDSVDIATLDDTIKWLRSDARTALKNQQGVTYSDRDLVSLERTLTGMRDNYLQTSKPELYDMLRQAESASKLRAAQFKNSAIGDLLVKDGPDSYRIRDAQAVYDIISKNDGTAARQFAELTKGNPEAKLQAQQMIYSLYRKAVVDPNTQAIAPKLHANFMRDYGDAIKTFFPEAEAETFQKLGGLGTQIAENTKALQKVLPQIQKTLGGDISSLNAPALARNVLSPSYSPDKIKVATRLLNNNGQGDLVETWKSAVLDEVGKRVIKDGQINQSALATLLGGQQKENLRALLNSGDFRGGDAYIKNLETLQEGVNMIRAQGQGQFEQQSRGAIVRLARLLFGQFSAEGRVVTYGAGGRTKAVPGEIYKAVTDQTEMSNLAKQTDSLMKQVKGAAYIGALGQVLSDGNFNY